MPLINVLKWDAPSNVFAFHFPEVHLNTKSQLIVAESQEAWFFKEGQMLGPLGPGRHVLDSKNYPFLTAFIGVISGFSESPYTAEIWYVNKAIPLNIRWGTPDPIQVQDAKYGILLPVRAFGQYGVQIVDSGRFLGKIVGSLHMFTEETLSDYFRGLIISEIKSYLGNELVTKKKSVLELSSDMNGFSADLNELLCKRFEPYGLKVVDFTVASISTDEQDPAVKRLREALAKKAEMNILGFNYQQERSFDVLQKAAANEGAGSAPFMGAEIGLGVGMGLGAPMNVAAGQMARQIHPAGSRFCPNCGVPVMADAKFCAACGHKLSD